MQNEYKFPDGFLWGTATAAHQIEGNNKNSDWWYYENNEVNGKKMLKEPSGIGDDSYNRYEEDFELCAQLNNNAVRISIEWARIEPSEGSFSDSEISHYRKVLKAAKDRGLKTFVTLHHFTNPLWLSEKGAWENSKTPELFARYSVFVAKELGDLIDVFLTINEPQVYALVSYIRGDWPPFKKNNFYKSFIVQMNLSFGHKKAYAAIKSVNPNYQVGIVKHVTYFEYFEGESTFIDRLACDVLNFLSRDLFLISLFKKFDLIGVNFYFTNRVVNLHQKNPYDYSSDMGWWINPGGMEHIVTHLHKRFKKPIYITENGLADSRDRYRKQFIRDHLLSLHSGIQHGADVRGYFHWSLIDNYEWAEGYWPRFGLVEIDRFDELTRKPRESFYYYGDIAKYNRVKIDLY